MRKILSFVSPELDITYHEVYTELAAQVEQPLEDTIRRFPPDEAVATLKYHRRQADRRAASEALARALGIDPQVVFSACREHGARQLLSALEAQVATA